MKKRPPEHTLEFLLAFDGRRHWYEGGYCLKFEIRRVDPTPERPHGLRYSITLHDPNGKRLLGFDNAHTVPAKGSRFKRRPEAADHWHRTASDPGRPYAFKDAAKLIDDVFDEVERVLGERGVPFDVVDDDRRRET
jgi:hypothetical protein